MQEREREEERRKGKERAGENLEGMVKGEY
jgi:hypothetical protein